tara:strand:+ start:1210 stop:2157 length:948 start_codon:yes stop_codon:yes gene_type:complete
VKKKLSIVIPCYNEESSILELYSRIKSVCKKESFDDYELVLINDGSKDKTWKIICELSKADNRIVGINLSRNFGHQIALTAGLHQCIGDRIFILDADLQDPPELLHDMMKCMDEGYDVVFGQRSKRQGETVFKKTSAYFFYRILNKLVDIEIPQDAGDFRLMSRGALDVLNKMPEQHRFVRGMVSWIGMRQKAISYERSARFAGETHYSLTKMIKFAVDAVTGFSIKPLRLASYFSFFLGTLALIMLTYVFSQYYLGNNIQGWTSLVTIVLLIGAIQLFVIGLLGEYIGRLYMQSKGRPLYIIQEVISSKKEEKL